MPEQDKKILAPAFFNAGNPITDASGKTLPYLLPQ